MIGFNTLVQVGKKITDLGKIEKYDNHFARFSKSVMVPICEALLGCATIVTGVAVLHRFSMPELYQDRPRERRFPEKREKGTSNDIKVAPPDRPVNRVVEKTDPNERPMMRHGNRSRLKIKEKN